jgi:SNF2 family DNA or RNA helicase
LTKHRDTLNAVALYTTFRNITHHPAIFFAHLNKLMEASGASESADTGIGPICQLLVNLVHQGKWQRFLTNLNTFKFDEIHSGKMLFLKHLVEESVVKLKEKIIIFSQSIDVLDYLQEYLPMMLPGPADGQEQPFPQTFRIDGATASLERERLVNLFNDDTHRTQIFLISTEAGGIGINLTGGCRVVLMDVSWNPSKDIQVSGKFAKTACKKVVGL